MKNIDKITCPICAIEIPLSVKECEFTINGKNVKSPTFGYECKKCEQDFTTTESDTFSLLLINFYESASSSNEDYVPSNSNTEQLIKWIDKRCEIEFYEAGESYDEEIHAIKSGKLKALHEVKDYLLNADNQNTPTE
jgi:hypothetical protein